MGLSSNILWHQTNKDGFYAILKSKKLRYSYSLERIVPTFKIEPIAFPMISVCDYPFSEIASNKWTYGDYCIGFNRSWGEKTGFSPVWYCSYGSRGLRQLDVLLKEGLNSSKGIFGAIMFLFANMKLDQAPLVTKKRKFKNYRFYDEREWRIVPYITESDNGGLMPFLTEEAYNEYKESHQGNSLTDLGVEFEYDNILYIVVADEEDVKATRLIVGDKIHIFTKKEVMENFVGVDHNAEVLPSIEEADAEAALRHVERIRKMAFEMFEQRKKQRAK